jgi:SAM-dependent methyltransferase
MKHEHHDARRPFDDSETVAIIGAEGEVAHGLTDQAIERACSALGWSDRSQVTRIADLGSGPGVDACTLAAAFPAATVAAVDSSLPMLAAVRKRAETARVARRVAPVALELDDEVSALGALDLAWAALSLHHARDSGATLERIAAQLRPGGALCLLERHTPLEVRPADELDRPGLWERVNDAQSAWYDHARASHHAHLDLHQLADLVASAGLAVVHCGRLASTTTLPVSPACELLLARHLRTALRNFRDALAPADLDALSQPDTLSRLSRSTATFLATRLLVIATAGSSGWT